MRRIRLLRALIPGWLALAAAGCHSWRAETVAPAELMTHPHPPGAVRITTGEGKRVELSSPWLKGDTLLGYHDGQAIGVGLGDIREVATRRGSTDKTLGLIFGTAAVAFAALVIIGQSTSFGLQ